MRGRGMSKGGGIGTPFVRKAKSVSQKAGTEGAFAPGASPKQMARNGMTDKIESGPARMRLDRRKRGGRVNAKKELAAMKKEEAAEGEEDEPDPEPRARGGWIKGATENKGALHRKLHVPDGEKIPAAKLAKASKSDDPTERKEANLAKTLGKMHKD